MSGATASPRARTLSVRSLVFVLTGALLAYTLAFALYLVFRVAPHAAELRRDTAPALALFEALTKRTVELDDAITATRRAVTQPDSTLVDSAEAYVTRVTRLAPIAVGETGDELRVLLSRSDGLSSTIETRLRGIVADLQLGRRPQAEHGLRVVDSLHNDVAQVMVDAQRLGLGDLVRREAALGRGVQDAVRVVTVWALAGGLLVALVLVVLRRRIARPIADLENALEGVAAGELGTRMPVRQRDEMGQLAAHFNDVAAILQSRAEEQGRFAAAGQLIAGVAHEVNNPLMAIAALADTRLDEPALAPELRGEFLQIRRQARRAGKLLSGLLRFVRSGEPRPTSFAVNDVLHAATDLVAYRFGVEEIVLEERLEADLPPAFGTPARLEQVFVNLLSNAVDAMTGRPGPRILAAESWAERDRICVAVADTGPGVAPDVRERLFHPFVTTKGAHGTGLGLYISRQIMREAGGDLSYQPGATGARFVVWLPAVPMRVREPAAPYAPPAPARPEAFSGVRVLVVDDEESVRAPLVKFLRRRGAVVLEAADGRAGLELLGREPVDAILADLRMPRMGGAEMYAWLAEHRPGLARRTVILSGDLSQLDGSLPVPRERVLAKPVELREIEAAVSAVLRAGGAGQGPHVAAPTVAS